MKNEEIKKLLSEISPWPWFWECSYEFHEECIGKGLDSSCKNIEDGRIHLKNKESVILEEWCDDAYDSGIEVSTKDARFIAKAPEIISQLLKQNEIMREALLKTECNPDYKPRNIYVCGTCSGIATKALKDCEEV